MQNPIIVEVSIGQKGMRLDHFLCEIFPDKSRSALQKIISEGLVCADGIALSKKYRLKGHEIISVVIPEPVALKIEPEEIPLEIIYEDNDLIVVNKHKEMVVHPAPGNYSGTLVNALLFHCKGSLSGINGVIRPGIVHRIDKDTSGLLIVAKNDFSHIALADQIKSHSFQRTYEAVVYGHTNEIGIIDKPIGRSEKDRKKMCVTEKNSKPAVTHYELLTNYGQFSHVRLKLETGRTHQIRVHMSSIGHPVAGDPVYGPKKCITKLNGQCLHAKSIGFEHPRTTEFLRFDSSLPDYFKAFINSIKNS